MSNISIDARDNTIRAISAGIARAAIMDDKITESDMHRIAAYAETLDPISPETDEVLRAVNTHYQHEVRTIQPADIRKLVKAERADRIQRQSREERQAREDAIDASHGFTPPDSQLGGLPIGGADGNPVAAAYEVKGAIGHDCPTCDAPAGQPCINKINGQYRRIPCLSRVQDRKRR